MDRAPDTDHSWARTRIWVEEQLAPGERVVAAERLRGGWTSEMRRLLVQGPGTERALVLRSFVRPFFLEHADGLLTREAEVLGLLGPTGVPAAELVAVDPTGAHCDHPSLLMTLLPGTIRLDDGNGDGDGPDPDTDRRADLLARQLAAIHRTEAAGQRRPRTYQAWTAPERVRVPERTTRPELWRRAVDVLRQPPPPYVGRFLHRDFHPGNVLFSGTGPGLLVSGVVDWVETSWGPADLDVAHCSTALALLHGAPAGLRFPDCYRAAGGELDPAAGARRYWRLLDALAFAPDAEKVAVPWRELGRTDLTPALLTARLEGYLAGVLSPRSDETPGGPSTIPRPA
ncbi:phosphotransferase family protein [Kitasatospora sp. NPDC051853]|uniref:phosphotransferase family protein n=1 Tax=Kitasatospora sp. NPDC051853 TaxID=3364058 RepID=UPI003796DE9F